MVPLSMIVCCVIIATSIAFARRARSTPCPTTTFNIELNDTARPKAPFELSCPHCDYMIILEDLSVVGHSLGCPMCEGVFLVLEPESVDMGRTQSAGV